VSKTEATLKVLTISQKAYNHQLFDLEQPQIAFSPDGRFLAVVCFEQGMGKVVLFTVADGRRLRTITMGKNTWMLNVTFAPDGRLAVIRNSQLSFIRVNDGKKMPTNIQAKIIVFFA
jgi:WD40 repeat protein